MSGYDASNARLYKDPVVIKYYTRLSGLTKQEQAVIDAISPQIKGKKILDMGIGGGRTIPDLCKLSEDYVGVDYSQSMVDVCKSKYPDLDLMLCDARNMNCFQDGQFDFVLFSFNGIDTVSHQDRTRILKEIHRVLSDGGYFVFSSHNRNFTTGKEAELSVLDRIRKAVGLVAKAITFPRMSNPVVRQGINRLKNKWRQVDTDEYAIRNDEAHDYSLLQYYISAQSQLKQLKGAGFGEVLPAFDKEGQPVDDCTESPWLYYCARK